jgi:hypothetical protein
MAQWINRLGMGSLGALVSWWFTVFRARLALALLVTAKSRVASGFHAQNHPNDVWR